MPKLVSILAVAVFAFVACNGGGSQPPISYCSTTADCPSDAVCEFPIPGGCGAQGECGIVAKAACAPQEVCSCTGQTESQCILDGYTTTQEQAVGACGADGGTVDAGGGDAAATPVSDATADGP